MVAPVAALLGGTTGGVPFDDVEFTDGGVTFGAVGQLTRQATGGHGGLTDRLAGLTGSLTGTGRVETLVDDTTTRLGVALEVIFQLLADNGIHDAFDFGIRQARLILRLELRVGVLDGDDGHEPFAHVVAVELGILIFNEIIGLRVVVNHAGERGTETREVGAAFGLIDEVRVAKDHLVVAVVVLQGDVEGHSALAGLRLLAVSHHARVG